MNLKQTRLVTENVEKLTRFYEYVTGAPATVLGSGYVEFQRSPCEGLAIAGTATVRTWSGRCRTGRQPLRDSRLRSCRFDAEYERLKKHISDWVQPPTQQPWGNRAMLFRDPDGNLINMFATPRGAVDA